MHKSTRVRSGPSSLLAAILASAALSPAQNLPPVPVPAGNPITPAKSVLGKLLFWEEQMSSNNRVACGTCHRPGQGGGDPRRAPNPGFDGVQPSPDDTFGSPGIIRSDAANRYLPSSLFGLQPQVTGRASPSAINGAWFGEVFWDGRAHGQFVDPETGLVSLPAGGALESQATGPVLSGVEMAHDARNWTEVEQKLQTARPMALATNLPPDLAVTIAGGRSYPDLFTAAFGDPAITAARIAFAIATYERTLVPDQTPYDQFVRGNGAALSPQQVNGLNLFTGPARCNLCHLPGLFSDGVFHNLGLRPIAEDSGRQAVSGLFGDRGRFKTPSLRNAGLRTGFMHSGQFTQLGQVIGFYNGGGGPNLDNKDPLLQPLNLPPQALGDLGNFIANGLTDPRVRDGLFPFDRPTLASERIPPAGFLFGPGSPGTGNRLPQILAEVPANVGNVDFKLGVANAVGGAASTLVVALQRAPIGAQLNGINVNVDIHITPALFGVQLNGAAGAAGAGYGTFAVPLPAAPGLIGITAFAQWFVWDTGVAAGGASTQGAEVRFF